MQMVIKWYLSGFYKKPKGLKKPYNPIIGETHRCYWNHPDSNSKTFYVAGLLVYIKHCLHLEKYLFFIIEIILFIKLNFLL